MSEAKWSIRVSPFWRTVQMVRVDRRHGARVKNYYWSMHPEKGRCSYVSIWRLISFLHAHRHWVDVSPDGWTAEWQWKEQCGPQQNRDPQWDWEHPLALKKED